MSSEVVHRPMWFVNDGLLPRHISMEVRRGLMYTDTYCDFVEDIAFDWPQTRRGVNCTRIFTCPATGKHGRDLCRREAVLAEGRFPNTCTGAGF